MRSASSPTILILGAGLAGASVAWSAHRRGWKVTLIDRVDLESCSHVAAGLVTPITGSRSAASWRWEEFFPVAAHHYQTIESLTVRSFWHPSPAMRIFQSEQERERAIERWGDQVDESGAEDRPQIELCTSRDLALLNAPFGGCWMSPAARLDTEMYLEGTRTFFAQHHRFVECDLDVERDLDVRRDEVRIDALGLRADHVVLCQGFEARKNRWFRSLPLHPARGDILDVSLESAEAIERVVHAESWIVPLGNGLFRTGATYDREPLDGIVDDRETVVLAREKLLDRLRKTIPAATISNEAVLRQRASVRPASYDRHPLMGVHPEYSNVFVLNGLGSKGSLMAPRLAELLCGVLAGEVELDPHLNWRRKATLTR